MTLVKLAKDSSGLLLARFLKSDGTGVTDTSPAGTTCTVTLTSAQNGTVILNAAAMTYDGSISQVDPDDGQTKTGWWKYQLNAANTAIAGLHRARAVAVNGAIQRAREWDVLIGAEF